MSGSGTATVETLVIGGGTAGTVVASRLAALSGGTVLLVEAGPDYGPLSEGRWPFELCDASQLPLSHDWGYRAAGATRERVSFLERARVIGGCSAHNGCQMVAGHRIDYDGWASDGNPGWSSEEIQPAFARALQGLRVRQPPRAELTPYGEASLEAMLAVSIPLVDDINDFDERIGVAPNPTNIVDGIRWNTAFAYLDPVRGAPNLRILDETTCDRLLVERSRVVGAILVSGSGSPFAIRSERTILAAGTYATPAVLLRSGIGDPEALRRAGIAVRHRLPGVGRNLQDHPAMALRFAGTPALRRASMEFAKRQFHPEEQLVAKVDTGRGDSAFDLHFYTQGGERRGDLGQWIWEYMVAVLPTKSRGQVTIKDANPESSPVIENRFFERDGREDLDVLTDGFALLRDVTKQAAVADLLGPEVLPGGEYAVRADIRSVIERLVVSAYHPVGTCKMGPANDPETVVDASLSVHGLESIFVVDASVMPTIPRANTNLPTVAIAEHFVEMLSGRG